MSSNSLVDPYSPTANTNTSGRSNSNVRSRPRRMVSFTDDDDLSTQNSAHSTTFSPALTPRSRGATPSPFASRGVSPLPMRHPSRATESLNWQNGDSTVSGGLHVGRARGKPTESRAADFLDASWSSLQSLASSVLGSDTRPTTNGSTRTHTRKPSRPDYLRSTSRSSTPGKWGPSGPSVPEIGAGTKEERHALVQAKKREVLLLADSDSITGRRHKRRDSCDQSGHSSIDPERDEGALAYVHHVQPTDTITGVTIKYGCQQAVMRKANGFWPSDSIQSRRTVLLPVDACSVKGRPIPKNVDLLGDYSANESPEDPNGSSISPAPTHEATPEDQSTPEAEGDRIWKHESFVQIDGFAAPVEIGRVPRRALGFFPRTRRKSVSYTDSEPPASDQSSLPFSPTESPAENTPPPGLPSPATSDRRDSRPPRHQRQRSGIQLSGPGVGTLDRRSMAPGPALDGLSKFFAQHLPNFAPQSPPPSFESASTAPSNTSTGLDNIGGTLEGWVRKMTTKAKASLNELQSPPTSGQPSRRMGDLIELDDAREGNLTEPLRTEFSRSTSSLQDAQSVRERFPSPLGLPTSRTRSSGPGVPGPSYGDRVKDD
ncbi:LysM domain protein [Aspergillus sclerotialis]|uniref:LysM domain protein n=1 Tax=Aspergillus sclerotialis TaxID=2070753 RepID=A0A3A2ZYE9_9EURO|nr:LysM domain protein [Aspergillus sclerotialis]